MRGSAYRLKRPLVYHTRRVEHQRSPAPPSRAITGRGAGAEGLSCSLGECSSEVCLSRARCDLRRPSPSLRIHFVASAAAVASFRADPIPLDMGRKLDVDPQDLRAKLEGARAVVATYAPGPEQYRPGCCSRRGKIGASRGGCLPSLRCDDRGPPRSVPGDVCTWHAASLGRMGSPSGRL